VDEAKEKTQELENEKKSLIEQMKIIASQAETEAMERRVIEQDLTDLEREKMMLELELKDSQSKNKVALRNLDMQAQTSKDTEADLLQRLDMLSKENEELSRSLEVKLQEKENKPANDDNQLEMEKLKKSLQTEKMLKQQAVNKLAEIMNRKDITSRKDKKAESKASSAELRKKEKENRRLQQELTTEKEKFNQMVAKYQKDLQDLQATLYEESQSRLKMSMELDTKESELETIQLKLAHINLDTASLSSGTGDFNELVHHEETSLEGWLQIPSKQNIRRHGWKKLYVIVSSKKIIFFHSETERQNADPTLILDLNKVFHVRSVTQGDVIRAEAKDIPRIFQILYAGEGESRKPEDNIGDDSISSVVSSSGNVVMNKSVTGSGMLLLKGHEFVAISYHMPASCDLCSKPLWAPFRPPPALECKRCRAKFHKDCVTQGIPPCKVSYDPTTAKDMLLMAPTPEEQQVWVSRLAKKVQKSGFKATMADNNGTASKEPMRSASQRSTGGPPPAYGISQKSATLPTQQPKP